MKTKTAIVATLCAAALLSGCDNARKALTQTKAAPDEFSVYTRAPLNMPPDYGLRPPSDSPEIQTEAENTKNQAKRVLLGPAGVDSQPIQADTPGTTALLARAGAHNAEPGIRDIVEQETSAYAEEDLRFLEKLMYGDKAQGMGDVVDPAGEMKRIQENQALGRPINEGDSPMIEADPTSGGLFDGLFN